MEPAADQGARPAEQNPILLAQGAVRVERLVSCHGSIQVLIQRIQVGLPHARKLSRPSVRSAGPLRQPGPERFFDVRGAVSAVAVGSPKRREKSSVKALRVREVTPVAVNRVLMTLGGAKKFDTARQARNVMSQVMMMCVRYGAAPFNPVRDAVTVRKPKRSAVRTIALEDIALLRKAIREWEERPALLRGRRNVTLLPQIVDTMLGTGLRIGECLALRVEDLDLDAEVPTLTVTGTVVRGTEGLMRQPKPKSDSSRRTISLPTFVVTAIREALDLGLDGGPDDLVFPSTKGTPRSPGRVREQLRAAQENIGVDVPPHDFRRTVATQVARATTLANATALLGHADESTTARHYVQRIHVAPDVRVVIDQLVERAAEHGSENPKR